MPTPDNLAAAVAQTAIAIDIEPPPPGTPAEELREWLDWWKHSSPADSQLTPDQVAAVKAGRWLPPVTAHQVKTLGPERMRLSLETAAELEAMHRLDIYRTRWAERLAQLHEAEDAATSPEGRQAIAQQIRDHYVARWPITAG